MFALGGNQVTNFLKDVERTSYEITFLLQLSTKQLHKYLLKTTSCFLCFYTLPIHPLSVTQYSKFQGHTREGYNSINLNNDRDEACFLFSEALQEGNKENLCVLASHIVFRSIKCIQNDNIARKYSLCLFNFAILLYPFDFCVILFMVMISHSFSQFTHNPIYSHYLIYILFYPVIFCFILQQPTNKVTFFNCSANQNSNTFL